MEIYAIIGSRIFIQAGNNTFFGQTKKTKNPHTNQKKIHSVPNHSVKHYIIFEPKLQHFFEVLHFFRTIQLANRLPQLVLRLQLELLESPLPIQPTNQQVFIAIYSTYKFFILMLENLIQRNKIHHSIWKIFKVLRIKSNNNVW